MRTAGIHESVLQAVAGIAASRYDLSDWDNSNGASGSKLAANKLER